MKYVPGLLLLVFAARAAAAVPIEIAASGHATVPVAGTFGVRQFVFDTGAEGTAVYADFADRAGLKTAGAEQLQGQTGTAELPLVGIDRLSLDGTVKSGLTAVKLDPRADGVPLAGIVGLDVFGERVVDFDLPRRQVALLPAGSRPIRSPAMVATPTTGGLLTVPVTVGGVAAVAVIDTGARKTRINWNLGRQLGLDPARLQKGDTIRGATNSAVETGATRIQQVRLGGRKLSDVPVLVADLPVFDAFGVADRPAVILGLDWLEKTRLVIDFPGRKVWFQAGAR